jgi:hypothetical protein
VSVTLLVHCLTSRKSVFFLHSVIAWVFVIHVSTGSALHEISGLDKLAYLTFVGPCIVIYFYSKTNQLHNISNLFYFGTKLYMFRTVSPSIIRSLRLYIQPHSLQGLWLLASNHRTCMTYT